jgi:hypothetical protein
LVVVLGVERLLEFLRTDEGFGPPIAGNSAKVCGPTIPSGASPLACWKRITACWVA